MGKLIAILICTTLIGCASNPPQAFDMGEHSSRPSQTGVVQGTLATSVQGTPADHPRGDI